MMLYPVFWSDPDAVTLMPGYNLIIMAPGIAALSVLQAALIRPFVPPLKWLWRTAAGGSIGALLGILIADLVFAPRALYLGVWTGALGLFIGAI